MKYNLNIPPQDGTFMICGERGRTIMSYVLVGMMAILGAAMLTLTIYFMVKY